MGMIGDGGGIVWVKEGVIKDGKMWIGVCK